MAVSGSGDGRARRRREGTEARRAEAIWRSDGRRRDWNAVRGPIGALLLSLHRIGWSMDDPLRMRDDWGEEIVLTKVAPALLADMLREATFRSVERYIGGQMASKHDEEFIDRRACLEQVRSQLKSDRKISPAGRAAYLSVACNAIMTYSRAEAGGYLVENRCPLCGLRGDDIRHRVWECQHPEVVAAREAVAPVWLREEIRRRPRSQTRWCTGFILHPGDVWPRPAAEATPVTRYDGEEPRPVAADGIPILGNKLYVDGSATTHVVAELRRAATAVVTVDCHGKALWRILMPVPSPMPQTSQSAEFVALPLVRAYLTNASSGAWDVASDCLNVVKSCNGDAARAIVGTKKYAGVLKPIVSDTEWRRRVGVRKVPAHVCPATLPPGPARLDAIGTRTRWRRRQWRCTPPRRPCSSSSSPQTSGGPGWSFEPSRRSSPYFHRCPRRG